MKNYLDNLPKPFIVLAPMDDVTDTVFRRLIAQIAPADLYFTEFVNVDGLQSPGRQALLKKLRFTNEEQPLIAQIWGKNPDNYYEVSKQLVSMGFSGVDINMGCPDKTVLKNACGGALIQNPRMASEIIKAVQAGVDGQIPVSVKTRIGFREYNEKWIRHILSHKLNMLSIHLRTVREMSKVPAHWELIGQIKQLRDEVSPGTVLVGNGDVANREHGERLCKEHDIEGAMIGRGVFHDPFACSPGSLWQSYSKEQRIKLYQKHVELFAQTWQAGGRPIVTLNKFCKIYINGFDGAKELREQLMHCRSTEELLESLSVK